MSSPFSTSQRPPAKAEKTMFDNNLTILRRYAGCPNPGDVLPKSVLFAETEDTITVFDAFPKSIFHFLVLPRCQTAPEDQDGDLSQPTLLQLGQASKARKSKPSVKLPTAHQLRNLPTMLSNLSKTQSKDILLKMQEAALSAKKDIEEEMIRLYGWKWDVWMGFHAVPSMEHLHLHVISADLISDRLKKKKHYNTFHPNLGFFVHLEEVLDWFDTDDGFFKTKIRTLATLHPILKNELVCFHCEHTFSNMPKLKKHLQDEWDKLDKQKKAGQARMAMFAGAAEKRRLKEEESKKRKSDDAEETLDTSHQDKRRKSSKEEVTQI